MPFTWIVTKSQPHADSVVIQLRRQGFDALALCCIEHRWHDWPELKRIGASGPALLFVTSRAAAARVEVPAGTLVAAIAPTTSATLEARGIRVGLCAHGGVRELAQAVADSAAIPEGARGVLSDQRRRAAPARASGRGGHAEPALARAYAGGVLDGGARQSRAGTRGLAKLRRPRVRRSATASGVPSAIDNFAAQRGFDLPPGPVVLIGGSTLRCWQESAPPAWRRAYQHDAETPLEWSLRFLERGAAANGS